MGLVAGAERLDDEGGRDEDAGAVHDDDAGRPPPPRISNPRRNLSPGAGLQDGEWRALIALIHQHLGTPKQRSESLNVNASGTLAELKAMSTEQLLARLEENGGELPPAA